ncbi:peptidylprolyl isomerase [Christensenella intestinihominis]|uniref:peptidylprolyl isomerase n=2 Tax=Christensenella intestinihominis TaxID=1851429 RepID=UPI0022E17843|nr:peptidylprolyl isomerase [Christensenella intestinihominis]
MNRMKKIMVTAVCAVLCVALASCSMVSVNEDKDRAQVVAEVNGTQITKGEVMDQVDMNLAVYGMTREQFAEQYGAEQFTAMKEDMLDQFVKGELLYQHAQADGLVEDTEEVRAEKRKGIEDTLASLKSGIEDTANADDTITDKDAYIEEQYAKYSELYGYKDIDKAVEDSIKTDAINAEVEKLNGEVSYSEEEAKAYYDELMETQKPAIEEDATAYTTYKNSGTVVYEPKGARYVKNLLIGLPDDVQSEIKTLRQNGDDEGADAKLQEELAKIKDSADAALARAKSGEDFDALIEELGTDTGMKSEPAKTKGYLVFPGSGMVEPFETASMALPSVGSISDLVPTDYGYHIIQYTSEGGGEVPFEDVKESITSKKLNEVQTAHQDETIEQWKSEESIKTYPDRLSTFA